MDEWPQQRPVCKRWTVACSCEASEASCASAPRFSNQDRWRQENSGRRVAAWAGRVYLFLETPNLRDVHRRQTDEDLLEFLIRNTSGLLHQNPVRSLKSNQPRKIQTACSSMFYLNWGEEICRILCKIYSKLKNSKQLSRHFSPRAAFSLPFMRNSRPLGWKIGFLTVANQSSPSSLSSVILSLSGAGWLNWQSRMHRINNTANLGESIMKRNGKVRL